MLPKNGFVKSHGLGNDYIVFDQSTITFPINAYTIQRICDVHYGIGSDGILLLTGITNKNIFGLRIFNPDGSEAEKSGNGLRIFAKFLFDYGYTDQQSFFIETIGGLVSANIDKVYHNKAYLITIDIGKANFKSKEIPVNCPYEECIDYNLLVADYNFKINCVSVGNPHCVILVDQLDEMMVKSIGAQIENHPLFPNRINVQFVKQISTNEIEMLIWERGAGYTLASGSSSCAAAAVMHKKGLVGNKVAVTMPGGKLIISITNDWNIRLCGEARQIAEGILTNELIDELKTL